MKITFEGRTIGEILDQMNDLLKGFPGPKTLTAPVEPVLAVNVPEAIATVDKLVDEPVDIPVDKSKRGRTAKQLENDARLRARAKAKQAERKAARVPMPPDVREASPPATVESLGLAPDEVVKVRQKTIEDLQSAYANGFHKEVVELLSRFGNGAKSFRELPPESFVPIREAIDNGALT